MTLPPNPLSPHEPQVAPGHDGEIPELLSSVVKQPRVRPRFTLTTLTAPAVPPEVDGFALPPYEELLSEEETTVSAADIFGAPEEDKRFGAPAPVTYTAPEASLPDDTPRTQRYFYQAAMLFVFCLISLVPIGYVVVSHVEWMAFVKDPDQRTEMEYRIQHIATQGNGLSPSAQTSPSQPATPDGQTRQDPQAGPSTHPVSPSRQPGHPDDATPARDVPHLQGTTPGKRPQGVQLGQGDGQASPGTTLANPVQPSQPARQEIATRLPDEDEFSTRLPDESEFETRSMGDDDILPAPSPGSANEPELFGRASDERAMLNTLRTAITSLYPELTRAQLATITQATTLSQLEIFAIDNEATLTSHPLISELADGTIRARTLERRQVDGTILPSPERITLAMDVVFQHTMARHEHAFTIDNIVPGKELILAISPLKGQRVPLLENMAVYDDAGILLSSTVTKDHGALVLRVVPLHHGSIEMRVTGRPGSKMLVHAHYAEGLASALHAVIKRDMPGIAQHHLVATLEHAASLGQIDAIIDNLVQVYPKDAALAAMRKNLLAGALVG